MSLHSVNQVFHIQIFNPMNCGNTIQSISQSHSTFIPNQLCFPLMLLLSPLSPPGARHFCIKQTLTLSHPTQDYCVIKTQQSLPHSSNTSNQHSLLHYSLNQVNNVFRVLTKFCIHLICKYKWHWTYLKVCYTFKLHSHPCLNNNISFYTSHYSLDQG